MFSFFKKDQSIRSDTKLSLNGKPKSSLGRKSNTALPVVPATNGKRASLAVMMQTSKLGDGSFSRTVDVEETRGSANVSTESLRSGGRTSDSGRRFIREVVVERRSDDQFDVQIIQDGDKLVACGPGFFPKDRLVSLNDRNLESMPADKVNRIIKSLAGRTLTIQVRSLVNHDDALPDRKQIKRFGTIRARQDAKATRNVYWLVEPDKYTAVQLLDSSNERARVRPCGHHTGAIFEVSVDRLEKANEAELDMSDDLSTLQFINETSILHILRTRAKDGYNCTFVGSAVMAVLNAEESKDSSVCDDAENSAVVKAFEEIYPMRPDCLPPHNLSAAYNASRSAVRGSSPKQCIVVMGSRQSDKSAIVRHSLKYLGLAHLRDADPIEVCRWVDDVCTLVECCCGTMGRKNHDCAVVYRMDVDGKGYACRFSAEALLVNRAKLFYRKIGPSRILCAISHCDRPAITRKFMLDEIDIMDNTFLHRPQDRKECQLQWRRVIEAFERLSTPSVFVNFVCAMAAVILHLGSCDISKLSGISLEVARDTCWMFPQIDRCAQILGIEKEILLDIIFARDAEMGDETELTPLRMICGFATACFNCLIEVVLFAVGQSLAGSGEESKSTLYVIRAPDISEFQQHPPSKPDPGANYSQLVSNYLNEKMHHLINDCLFDSVQRDLQKEHPECNFGLSQLYSFDPMRRLMEEAGLKLGQQGGLLRLLDNPFVSHEEVIRQIYAELWRCGDRTISVINNPAVFCVYHFGGNLPVIYDPSDWYAVFKDLPISSRFVDIFDYSQCEYIRAVRRDIMNSEGDRISHGKILRSPSGGIGPSCAATADRIESEMKYLLSTIRSCQIQACYCMTDGPTYHNDETMRKQLRALSVVPNCQLYQKALTVKMSHRNFVGRYACLNPAVKNLNAPRKAVDETLRAVCTNSYAYKVVSSSVFMRQFLAKELEFRLEERIETDLIKLQSLCRAFLARSKFKDMQLHHRALQCIQRNGRVFVRVRQWAWWKLFVSVRTAMPIINHEERTQELEEEVAKLNKRLSVMQNTVGDLRSLNKDYEQQVAFFKRLVTDRRGAQNGSPNKSFDTNIADLEAKLQSALTCIEEKEKYIASLEQRITAGVYHADATNTEKATAHNGGECQSCSQLAVENSSLRKEVESLREAVLVGNDRVSELEKADQEHLLSLADLKTAYTDLEELKAKLESEKRHLEDENEELLTKLQQVQSSSRDQAPYASAFVGNSSDANEVHHLKQQLKSLERNIADLNEELNERNDQIASLEQACLKSDLQLQQERKAHMEEINQKDEEFEHFQSNYQARLKLQQEKQDEEANENMRLRKQIRLLEAQLNESRLESRQNSCSDELLESLKKKIVRYKALLSDARFQLDQATRSDEMELLVKSLRSNVKELEEENVSMERSRQALRAERDEIQSEVDECQRQIARVKQELELVTRENRNLLERYEEAERESGVVISQLQERTSALSACQLELNTLKATLERVRLENARLQAKVKDLEATAEMYTEDTTCKAKFTDCRVNELENQLAVEELLKKRLQNQIDRLKEQNESHLANLNECRTQLELLEAQLKESQAEVRCGRKECDTLKSRVKEAENQKQILEETEAARCKEISNLRSQLRSAYERMNRLNDVLVAGDDDVLSENSPVNYNEDGGNNA